MQPAGTMLPNLESSRLRTNGYATGVNISKMQLVPIETFEKMTSLIASAYLIAVREGHKTDWYRFANCLREVDINRNIPRDLFAVDEPY